MKKILLIIGILFTLNSCSDFIEEDNRAFGSAETYFLTAPGFESLVNTNYATLKDIYGGDPWLFEAGTDMYSEGRNQEPEGLAKYLTLSSSSAGVDLLYRTCYMAIQQANKGLYYANLTEKTSTLDTRVGELKFLRANAYFLLVQTYGGVPIVLDNYNTAVTSFDRNTAEQVYTQIFKDLNEALPAVATGAYTGRVNKRAVQDLLAKVYLTRGYETFGTPADFTTAASIADEAIAGQALNVPFASVVQPGNEMNAETIFSVQFSVASNATGTTALGSSQNYWFSSYLGAAASGNPYPNRSYTLCPTVYALSLYEQGDKRWENTFMTEIYSRYYDFYTVTDKTALKITDFYEPRWFTLADRTAWNTANASRKANAATFRYHNWGTYSSAAASGGDYNLIPVRKFDDPNAPYSGATSANYNTTPITPATNRSSTRDFIVARLGETYLVAAEAYFKAGQPTLALARLNEVRRRAGGGVAGVIPVLTSVDINTILDERGRELLGEYHRWFDLKRTGTLVERTVLYNPKVTNAAAFMGQNGNLKILRPIPQSALDLNRNKDFPQNPAY
ncbi:RagB/SusD family nutrient uptake outer membrane protein [Flavobacterium sp. ANB]|uniref:RagB/SusD family nutrient uptake outer membrane protein n=1 Tax=unclassified Flavobacterium TaxID=196869 RepID=UPI0012B92695|nr:MULTISPECIES: RagB/SusD family nutrient uptake outer membrane protein [unclassified Flavobacterium]MBF4516716.1 RagB/SusD family nutrient uptake outer membrane protein [Flavobacterium sp. ANB]MTD69388.1 RagB/SusD family nutrient uptake outer membrane protein [Flavobacterium sp. LC2016-13]